MADKRVEKTLVLIRSCYFKLKFERKAKKITVTDICQEANINRGTFYRYYVDALDLEDKIETQCVNELIEALLSNYSYDGRYSGFLDSVLEYVKDHRYEFELVVGKMSGTNAYSKFCNKLCTTAMPVWIKRGNVNERTAAILLKYIAAGIYSLLGNLVDPDETLDLQEFKKLYYNIGTYNISNIIY